MPNIIIIAYFEEKYNIPTDYYFVAVLLLFCAAIWAPILNILLNNMALSDIRPHEYHPERYD
jgi:hypothetical protein